MNKKYCKKCGYDTAGDKCPICGCNNFFPPCDLTYKDVLTISKISTEPSFFDAMVLLKEKDIIEYELKMTQFRKQITQAETQNDNSNVPKCPTCGSTNVEKISLSSKVVGGVLWGLFSSNVRKTMHCKQCGYKW